MDHPRSVDEDKQDICGLDLNFPSSLLQKVCNTCTAIVLSSERYRLIYQGDLAISINYLRGVARVWRVEVSGQDCRDGDVW